MKSAPVLFVSGEYPPDVGGVGDYTDRLRAALAARSWPSRVLSRAQVRRWDARSLVRVLRAAPRRGIVHIEYQAGAYDLLGDVCLMPMLLRGSRPGVRVAATFHDARVPYLFPKAGALRSRAVALLARTSHAMIAADPRDLALLGGTSARQYLVPIGSNVPCAPGVDYDRAAFRARLGLGVDDRVVVYFGLLNASKGLDMLLDAFELVLASGVPARLLLLGGEVGASDPTDRLTATRVHGRLDKLGRYVVRAGWLAAPDLSRHLLAGDVALLPYADGASPRRGSLLACAEHGLPIVSTQPATGAAAGAVEAVPPNASALAEAVLRIVSTPTLLRELQASSRALAARSSWPRIADTHIEIYAQLLKN